MRGLLTSHVRGVSRRRVLPAILFVASLALVGALVVARAPRPIAAMGALDQCQGGWPVVVFDGEAWRAALPDDVHNAPRQIPVAAWPSGMHFDEKAGVLLDAQGNTAFRKGDTVRVTGSIVRVGGDPAPCYLLLGVRVETIAAA